MTIGERIKKLMEDQKLSEIELARRSKVHQPTIHRIINGVSKDPRPANLEKIAKALGLTYEQLRKGPLEPTDLAGSENSEITKVSAPHLSEKLALDIYDRPILELQRDIETGSAIFRVVGHQRVEAEQLEMVHVRPQDVCIIQTVDDGLGRSMGAGVRLAIDRSKPLADGKIYALRYGNLLRIRLVFQKPDGGLLLKALNPDYPEELISAQERAEMVEVIGLAFMALNVPL